MKQTIQVLVALLMLCAPGNAQRKRLDIEYRDVASQLIGAALVDEGGWRKLSHLTTQIGPRLSGSPQLERALQWMFEGMRTEGLENVRLQPLKVPHWVRGNESVRMSAPFEKPIAMLGLGGSVGTLPEGVTAAVIVVRNYEELEMLGRSKVEGKIVLYDDAWKDYGGTYLYRDSGAAQAGKFGAVAALVRSTAATSLYTAHTGNLTYSEGIPKIPAAAITVEDAAWIRRLVESGTTVRVCIRMDARNMPDADSANVMGEITGRELPDEVVLIGGHIDSWDVGQGAHDDGCGTISAWQVLSLMKQLGLKARRTMRAVGWTNDENGARGGKMYRDGIAAQQRHVAAIEMDDGAERPLGFNFSLRDADPNSPKSLAVGKKLKEIGKLLEAIGANQIVAGGSGTDVAPLLQDGTVTLDLFNLREHYFDWHHSHADTLDKIDPQNLRRCTAALAVMAYVLADMPGALTE
jgi:carboxypeptidase Q